MKRSLPWILMVILLTACGQLDTILFYPTQTAETWLNIQPFIKFNLFSRPVFLIQPSTSLVVYLLGLLGVASGIHFLTIRRSHKSRFWWGIALMLWGFGALFAGTSYEAFSYAIKCAGREACLWTSWWEIIYLVLSVASLDAILVAEAYTCVTEKWRKGLIWGALVKFILYSLIVLTGVFIPVKFLISFELLIIICIPNLLIFLVLNGWRYLKYKTQMDLVLLGTWGWLLLTIAAYFLYNLSGLTQKLWIQGIWFSDNDVLHIGLIIWMMYIVFVVAKQVQDKLE